MIWNKRFTIENSNIVDDGYFIEDNMGSFTFPTTKDKSDLIMYEKHLNELADENKQLKYQNEMLSEELEQAKAVINKKWDEYLKKKELIDDDME